MVEVRDWALLTDSGALPLLSTLHSLPQMQDRAPTHHVSNRSSSHEGLSMGVSSNV